MQLHYSCTTTTTTTTIYDADDHCTLPDLSKDWFTGYSSIRVMMMMMMMMMIMLMMMMILNSMIGYHIDGYIIIIITILRSSLQLFTT